MSEDPSVQHNEVIQVEGDPREAENYTPQRSTFSSLDFHDFILVEHNTLITEIYVNIRYVQGKNAHHWDLENGKIYDVGQIPV